MKIFPTFWPAPALARRSTAAFTLAEIMTAAAVFSLVIIGVVYSHLFGLRLFNITATRLGATAGSRAALNRVCDDIRSGKVTRIVTTTGSPDIEIEYASSGSDRPTVKPARLSDGTTIYDLLNYYKIDSTNTAAMEAASTGAPEGSAGGESCVRVRAA